MRKFTKIEEELLKEAAEAKENLNKIVEDSISKIDKIKSELKKVSNDLEYVDIMTKMNKDLNDMLLSLFECEEKKEEEEEEDKKEEEEDKKEDKEDKKED